MKQVTEISARSIRIISGEKLIDERENNRIRELAQSGFLQGYLAGNLRNSLGYDYQDSFLKEYVCGAFTISHPYLPVKRIIVKEDKSTIENILDLFAEVNAITTEEQDLLNMLYPQVMSEIVKEYRKEIYPQTTRRALEDKWRIGARGDDFWECFANQLAAVDRNTQSITNTQILSNIQAMTNRAVSNTAASPIHTSTQQVSVQTHPQLISQRQFQSSPLTGGFV